jgi:hypothetical protein
MIEMAPTEDHRLVASTCSPVVVARPALTVHAFQCKLIITYAPEHLVKSAKREVVEAEIRSRIGEFEHVDELRRTKHGG